MKNKDKYKLTSLKFKVENMKNHEFRLPTKRWKVLIYDSDGKQIDLRFIDGGGISDVMAWLEREADER